MVFTEYRYKFHSGAKFNFILHLHERCCAKMTQGSMWALVMQCNAYRHSTWPLTSYLSKTLYLLHMIPVQNIVRFHTGKNVLYWYENLSELVLVQHFVPVSWKRIQSYKWELGWTCTRMKLVLVPCKHPHSRFKIMAAILHTNGVSFKYKTL